MKSTFKKIIGTVIEWQAKLILRKYKPKIVAVTGSVGKTSTKDAIFSVMSQFFYTRKSEKSFNSDIGIPLTIMGCPNGWYDPILWLKNILEGFYLIFFKAPYPQWLVLEVGADRPNDIKNVTKWLKPDVVVLTAFAKVPVHIEFFKNRDAIIREKKYLVDALKHDGVLVVNGDDDDAMKIKDQSKNISIIYGTSSLCDLIASDEQIYYEDGKPTGMTFKVKYENNIVPVVVKGSLGMQNVYASLAALAAGLSQKVNLVKAGEALLNHETPKGRMRIISGIQNSVLIDDTYNSSPVAATSALNALKDIQTKGRKIAILGDMMELGKHSVEEHYEIGKLAAQSCNILLTVGIRSRKIAEGALDAGMDDTKVFQYDNSDEVMKDMANLIQEGDTILVKGSQSMRMEKIVKAIMAEPEKASELLVRQDEEWKKK